MTLTYVGTVFTEFSVPVTEDVELLPAGVNAAMLLVPVAVKVCVCVASADPVKVGCVKLPAAIVGTPTGQEIVGCVKEPAAIVGTPAGHETVGCVNVPPAIVGGFAGQEIAPSVKAPALAVGTFVGQEIISAGTVMEVDPEVSATPPNESGL